MGGGASGTDLFSRSGLDGVKGSVLQPVTFVEVGKAEQGGERVDGGGLVAAGSLDSSGMASSVFLSARRSRGMLAG
jgi:hypothetical protein